ncbi:MAG: hypothetical protein JWN85_234 [Gammaproteobacteria bacterium]|nr:hypothetical protein [Gammaproteobacteria bacterium]
MSAVLLAVFNDYEAADLVRAMLVRDGFPTDRVELTACCELGRAGLGPADSPHGKIIQYFRTLFRNENDAELLAGRVENGAATITVHPRGTIEITRANEIFAGAAPVEVAQRDLGNQRLEYAAAHAESPWILNFLFHSTSKADCLYCRLFERNAD